MLKKNIVKIKHTAKLINELQQERGLSSGYLASKGVNFKNELIQKRHDVDLSLTTFTNISKNLTIFRKKIDSAEVSTKESFDFYTMLIKNIQANYLQTVIHVNDLYLNNKLQAYTNLSFMKEALGQMRATLSGIFVQKGADIKLIHETIHSKGMYDVSLYRFQAVASPKFLNQLRTIQRSQNYLYVKKIISHYMIHHTTQIIEDPHVWFNNSTSVINRLYQIEQNYFTIIDTYIDNKTHTTMLEFTLNIVFFIFIILFTTWLGE